MGEGRSHWPCTGPVPGSEIKPPLRTLRACAREHPVFLLKPRLRPSQLAGGDTRRSLAGPPKRGSLRALPVASRACWCHAPGAGHT